MGDIWHKLICFRSWKIVHGRQQSPSRTIIWKFPLFSLGQDVALITVLELDSTLFRNCFHCVFNNACLRRRMADAYLTNWFWMTSSLYLGCDNNKVLDELFVCQKAIYFTLYKPLAITITYYDGIYVCRPTCLRGSSIFDFSIFNSLQKQSFQSN